MNNIPISAINPELSTISGWGRNKSAKVEVLEPKNLDQLQEVIAHANSQSLIPRGLGRSYGDAAQLNLAQVINMKNFNKIELNANNAYVTAGGGVSIDQLLRVLIPSGFFLPVTPGTRYVTIGGAIAADVHGKNHHVDGSFGNHVKRIVLIDGQGNLRELTPKGNGADDPSAKYFWATVGGMGLTGVIVEATFSLISINSSRVRVETQRFVDLDSLMNTMIETDKKSRYSVAWVDSLSPKGRGILSCGEHASTDQLSKADKELSSLSYDPQELVKAPRFIPGSLLNKYTVRAFNAAWYRKASHQEAMDLQSISQYFHPLDGVQNWNRIYGRNGFLQYQFVVPNHASDLIPRTLELLRELGAPTFLTVLKRFGKSNPAPLSFPMPGWTLAVDIPCKIDGLFKGLDQLDEKIASAGGRLYLAKDSRQSSSIFERSYPQLDHWKQMKSELDPNNIFCSDLYKRIT